MVMQCLRSCTHNTLKLRIAERMGFQWVMSDVIDVLAYERLR